MKEIPILFSTSMVQSILKILKRMTRRTRGLEKINQDPDIYAYHGKHPDNPEIHVFARIWKGTHVETIHVKCPYGKKGDLIWVRESFSFWLDAIKYKADGESVLKGFKYKPSIHMPKDYARIWLQVEEIRVERLQDITEEDAIAEGVEYLGEGKLMPWKDYNGSGGWVGAKTSFISLWIKINGKESWDLNPWVWVVKFKVLSTTGKPQTI